MNRNYRPISRALRSTFVVCAMTITATILLFIDLLASDRGTAGAQAAVAAIALAVRG
jgi:ribonuclease PH